MAVRWGIISTAAINRRLIGGARQSSDLEIVAVASRELQTAERYAAEHGIERAYGSYEALLADPELDVVYISLPNALHVEWTIRALEAGKHVLCEKPLSRHPSEVERCFDVAERQGRLLMEAFMYRHNPLTRRLATMVSEGAVGRLRMIRAAFSFAAAHPADIRLTRSLGGGSLMDVGCYCVNGTRLLAGEPIRVSAEQALGGDGVDIAFSGVMRFPDDVLAHFDAGLALARREQLEVAGDEGTLYLSDPWLCGRAVIEHRRGDQTERVELETVDSYRLEAENLSAAIRGEAEPLLGRADAVGQARAIEALYAAAESGRSVAP